MSITSVLYSFLSENSSKFISLDLDKKNIDNLVEDVINCTGNAKRRNSSVAYFAKRASVWCKEEKALHEYAFEHPPEHWSRVRTVAPVTAREFVGTP